MWVITNFKPGPSADWLGTTIKGNNVGGSKTFVVFKDDPETSKGKTYTDKDHISQPLYDPATGKPPSAAAPLASGATSCTGVEEECKGQTQSSFLGSCNCKPGSTSADCSGCVRRLKIED